MSDGAMILAMMLVTFLPRYIPFALAGRLDLSPLLVKALGFVPIAILTAIITLNSVVQENEVAINLENHHLLAAVVSAFTAYFSRKLGLTVATGLLVFFSLRWMTS